jgi:hypothetical protein
MHAVTYLHTLTLVSRGNPANVVILLKLLHRDLTHYLILHTDPCFT